MTRINLIFCSLLLLSVAGCKKGNESNNAKVKASKTNIVLTTDQMNGMRVETTSEAPLAEEFAAVGEVSFDENNVVRIYPIVSGTVEKVNVSLGDYVQRGQLLATLLSTDITTFQRDYNVAKANLEVDDKNFARAKELYAAGMISEKDFAEAKNDYMNALSDFTEKKQILELYGGSSDRLDAMFRVIAPRSGYIVERNINEGTQIRTDNNTAIFTISDLKSVWIWANVHESDMGKVKEGDKVSVTTIAYPKRIFKGIIKKIGTMLDPASRVIRVRSELGNEEGLLKPEMFATVVITSQTTERVLAIPQKALILENNLYYAMRQVSSNTFEKVNVQVGKKFNDLTEVTGGLTAGDKIIVEGSLFALTAYNLK
ncbi:MAG: efflux RND transporter periplasmic adaptor subunit [Cyclobacteriaceae bacterium]